MANTNNKFSSELMDDVAMDLCNRHSQLNYDVAPTLFLEFHGTEDSVISQAKTVGNFSIKRTNKYMLNKYTVNTRFFRFKGKLQSKMVDPNSAGLEKLKNEIVCGKLVMTFTGQLYSKILVVEQS